MLGVFVLAAQAVIAAGTAQGSDDSVLDAPKWEDVKAEYPDRPLLSGEWDWAMGGKFASEPKCRTVSDARGPHFELNGEPFFPFCGWVNWSRRPDRRRRIGDLPVNLVTVTCPHSWWTGVDGFDPSVFDRQAERYCREYPDAYFLWDLSVYPSMDWAAANPDELCRDDTGAINQVGDMTNDVPNFSFASVKAVAAVKAMTLRALEHLERSPYANRIVGYRVNSGHSIEWLYWYPEEGRELDFADVAKRGFAAYAAANYPELRDRSVPTREERRALDDGALLWDRTKHLKVVAYWNYLSHLTSEALIDVVGAARARLKALGKTKLVGTYYGYTMTLNYDGLSHWRAHYALKRVLDAGIVDFLISPPDYTTRNAGGMCTDMKPFASMNAHGIVTLVESDLRTAWGPFLTGNHHAKYQMPTAEKSIGLVRRDMSVALCRNQPMSMYAICTGTDFDDPRCARDTGILRKVGEFALRKGIRRRAEVAVVVSEETVKSMANIARECPNGELEQVYVKGGRVLVRPRVFNYPFGENNGDNYVRYARAGAPVDYVLAEDLAEHPGNYRLYIFTNAYVYDAKFLAAVDRLRARGATLLWSYAPGYTRDGVNSVANMERLTGIRLAEEEGELPCHVRFPDGKGMGTERAVVKPVFRADDPAAETLAVNAKGHAGVAVKRIGTSVAIFAAPWQFTVPFLADAYRRAGVHLYSDSSDPMEANDAIVALHARFPGRKTIRLPRKTDVLDVFGGRIIAHDADSFSYDADLHSTSLFYCGEDAAELLNKLEGNDD